MKTGYMLFLVLTCSALMIFQTLEAQVTYGSAQYIDAGNPGGLNTEGDAPGLSGWTNIMLGPQSSNIWSPANAIPFPFVYFGTPLTHFKASQNGLVTFDTATALLPDDNTNLPSASLPSMTIACYWDHFTSSPPTGSGDDIRTKEFGTAPNRQFWIKWYSFEYGTVSFSYFAVVLEETTNKIYLVDLYNSTSPLLTTTAGLQLNTATAAQFGDSTIAQGGNGSSNTDNDYIEFFLLAPIDAGIAAIDSPTTPLCTPSDLWATIENFGTMQLDSAEVHWTVNGVPQPMFNWIGPLPPGMSTPPVHIGPYAFADGDQLVVWTDNPNGGPDGNHQNDTALATIRFGLPGGVYTIGGPSPDYVSFSAAVADLNSQGICGPVVFNAAPGIYNEQIELLEILGTSATNTVTFNGNATTILFAPSVSDARHIIRLNGADYVTFNDLVIQVDSGATYGWGVQLSNNSDNNSLVNCTVNGDLESTSSVNFAGIVATGSNTSPATAGDNANNLTIDGCTVVGGYYGIRVNGSTSVNGMNNTIKNSTIQDAYVYNIYLQRQTDALVSGNDIMRPNRTGVSTFYGVAVVTNAQNLTVEKNRIHNTHGSATSLTGTAYGVYFSSVDATLGQENIVKNNLVYDFNGNGTVYAFYNIGSDGVYYYNNTVSLDHTPATGGTTRGFYQTTAASNIDFRNNIVTITRGGSGVKHGLYFATTTSTIISNNNAIYLNSAGTGAQYFGNFGGTDYPTFNDWRTANGGIYDSLSVNADPLYIDVANDTLIPSSGLVNDIGVSLAEVTEDILGNPRPPTPDPGAYEFDPSPIDMAITQFVDLPPSVLPNTVVDVDIEVTNAGTASVSGDTLDFYINGIFSSSLAYGALAGGESDTVSTIFTASASGADQIMAALRPVSGDANAANDTLRGTVEIDSVYTTPYLQDFEAGIIGTPGTLPPDWTNELGDDFDWYVDAGGTPSTGTGPAVDHTLGTSAGKYMYTEATGNFPALVAHLTSPYVDLTGIANPGVEFWFHMYGAAMGELHVDVWSSGNWINDVRSPLVGEYQTSNNDLWLRAGVDLTQFAGNTIKIRFRGITGSSFTSDMAIDDVRFDELDSLAFPYMIQARRVETPLLTKMPLTQTGIVSAIDFEGSFTNEGPSDTGDLTVDVVNTTTVFSNTLSGVTFPAFRDSLFSLGQWNASSAMPDMYTILIRSSNFTGPNDTATSMIELGETMGYDNGNHTNNIAHTSTSRNLIGTRFTLTDADTLTSVTMLITSSTVATDSFAVDLYTSVSDTPGTVIGRIFRGTFGEFAPLPALVTFMVPVGIPMPAGDFYAILDMDTPSAASFPIGADNTGLGAARIPRRFAARSATSAWLFFENAGNPVFHALTPIIRVGFQEAPPVPSAKLLITEFVVTPTGNEFIEIYNSTAGVVDLTNHYLTDATFAGDGSYYYNIVRDTLYGGGGFGDFHSRFPAGSTIAPSEYQTVALNGNADFFAAYGINPTYEIDQAEFAGGTPDTIPDMLEARPGSIYGADSTHNPGLTNGDEVIILYYWDGMSDLVEDVDYVLYNSGFPVPNDEAVDKSGVLIDGPDPDTVRSAYLDDVAVNLQLSAANHPGAGQSVHRIDMSEGSQIQSGGNGVTGGNEMSEDLNNTFSNNSQPTPNAPYQPLVGPEPQMSLNHTPGNLTMGIFNDGSIGAENVGFTGPGVTWRGEQGLFVGGPIFGTSSAASVNGLIGSFTGHNMDILNVTSNFAGGFASDANFDQISSAVLNDSGAPTPFRVRILQQTYSDTGQEFGFVRYGFVNLSGSALNDFYAGIFIDWDIGTFTTNSGGYDTVRGLVYNFDVPPPAYYYGMAALDGLSGARTTTATPTPTVRQGSFTFMTTFDLTIGANGDYRNWMGAGPQDIAPGDTAWATFAVSAGDSLNQLRTHIDSAQAKAFALGWVTRPPVGVDEQDMGIPARFELAQNYPNPFNPATRIQYALPKESFVTLKVYNILGQEVVSLVNQVQSAGFFTATWNGRNALGGSVGSGLYFYRIEARPTDRAGSYMQVKKMLLVK